MTDYTRRKNQFDTVYGEYLSSYRKRIMRKIRDGCKLQLDDKFNDALKLYDEAIAESITNDAEISLAYIKRAMTYCALNNTDAASADFARALELDNDPVGKHLIAALALERDGNKIQAAQDYRAFVAEGDIAYYDGK